MSHLVAVPNLPIGSTVEPSQSVTTNGDSPPHSTSSEATTDSSQDKVAHMRRRLFRTLDQPSYPMFAVDCGAIPVELLKATTGFFLTDGNIRDTHNLVLAVPTDEAFSSSSAFDVIQAVKQSAFENGFDGKVSWLLIEDPSTEIPALQKLVEHQGGKWHASV